MNVKMNVTNNLNINWSKIDPKFVFAAMDSNGWVMLYREHPEIDDPNFSIGGWCVPSTPDWGVRYTCYGKSLLTEQVDWTETLTQRPDEIEK